MLVRFPNGIGEEFFYQKRAPKERPAWIDVVTIRFPSGRTADEIVPRHAADLAWMANLACLELHPHPVRASDVDHPDELRIDLDPVAGVPWSQVREVAAVVEATLADHGLRGWPKTSGKRGLHVLVRIEPRWTFGEVRRAALALARDVEQRVPQLATTKWWKEERRGVFIDYNQNAKDRTVAGAYSVRPTSDARVLGALGVGRSRRRRSCGVHLEYDARTVRARRRPPRRHRRAIVFAAEPARVVGAPRARRPGRRAMAARSMRKLQASRPVRRRPGSLPRKPGRRRISQRRASALRRARRRDFMPACAGA
jgi:DNA ligase D-like protein (predicted polymerase)